MHPWDRRVLQVVTGLSVLAALLLALARRLAA